MKKKNGVSFRELFDNKKFVQIFSLVAAAFLWLLVAMTQSNTTTVTVRDVPVKVDAQSSALTSIGLHAIEDENLRVDVEVEGLRSVVGQLKPEDFSLSAKLTGVTEAATYELTPTSADVAPNQDYLIKSFTPEKVKIRFDRVSRKGFEIEERVKGLAIAPGYTQKSAVVSPDTVYIEGPATEIEKIATCAITAEIAAPLDRNYSVDLPITLYDSGGNELEPEALHLNMDRSEAQLTIQVLRTTNLPLTVDFTNIPKGFPKNELLERTKISQLDVTLAGPFDLIDKLTEIQLGYIDLKALTLDKTTFSFDVPMPLPSDQFMRLDNVTSVVVDINDYDLKSAVFNVSSPRLLNAPPDFEVTLLANTIYNVEFVGKKEIIDSMTASDIVAEIDLSEREITSGSYPIPVKISVPGKGLVWAVGDHNITIQAQELS